MSNEAKKTIAMVDEKLGVKAPSTAESCLDAAAQLVACGNADLAAVCVEMAKVRAMAGLDSLHCREPANDADRCQVRTLASYHRPLEQPLQCVLKQGHHNHHLERVSRCLHTFAPHQQCCSYTGHDGPHEWKGTP